MKLLLLAVTLNSCLPAAMITGMVAYSADSSGASTGQVWNTQGGDLIPNLYVTVNGAPVNGGNGAFTSIKISLPQGLTDFSYCGDGLFPSTPGLYYGLSIFMNGNNNTPAFTFFWRNVASRLPVQPTTATSPNLAGVLVAGGGGGPFVDGNTIVTIVDVPRWAGPNSPDLVSKFDNVPGDSLVDWCCVPGQLLVTVTPEPETWGIVLAGLAICFAQHVRSRRLE